MKPRIYRGHINKGQSTRKWNTRYVISKDGGEKRELDQAETQ
jgi:hypothetical protein